MAKRSVIEQDANFGIDLARMPKHGMPVYRRNGVEISREDALNAVAKGLPDDMNKLWLTLIGPKADRDRVVAGLPADIRERVKLNAYDPDHWAVAQGFVNTGKPTIYLQAPGNPGGEVLHRQDDFQGAKDFEAIRKAVADYDSRKDPDLRKPSSPTLPPTNLLIIIGGGVAIAAAYLLTRK